MKTATLITALFLSLTALGQEWKKIPVVDEFEEPTGDTVISTVIRDGKFSNSATITSDLCVKIVDHGKEQGAIIYLFEYCRSKASFGKSSQGKIRFRTNDQTYESDAFYSRESQLIMIAPGSTLYEWISSGKHPIKVLISEKEFGGYGSSKYIFECESKNAGH